MKSYFRFILALLYAFRSVNSHDVSEKACSGRNQECEWTGDEQSQVNKTETFVMGGNVQLKSKLLPLTVTRQMVATFFNEEKQGNLLVIASAGGSRSTQEVLQTEDLLGYWEECCHDSYGLENLPTTYDPVYVTNTTSQFPGMQLTTTVYNGIKVLESKDGMPRYVFNMIAEQQTPEGLPPIVWAFHKLFSSCQKQDSFKPCGRAKLIVQGVENADKRLALSYDVMLRIAFEVPRLVVKLMPMRKEKAEAFATKVLMKTVLNDVKTGLDGFYRTFLDWHKNHQIAEQRA